jgi:hypothetical protein
MFFWIMQQITLSIIFIISVHYIYLFLKNNLTVPKTKDLVKRPVEKYKDIYNSLSKKTDNIDMKNELKDFMNSNDNSNKDNLISANITSNFSLVNEDDQENDSETEEEYHSEWLMEKLNQ